jgi:hypothetical protein
MATRSKSSFKYKPHDEKKLKERAEQTGGRFDSPFKENTDMFRPKAGDNTFRILPPTWDNHEHYGFDIWVHSYVGADNSTYLCPSKMKSKPCPICDAAREAKSAGEEDDAKQLSVARRVVCWVIDRDADEDPAIPKLYSMSWSQDRDIAALCTNKRTGKILLIDHPDEGYDVSMKKTGQGLKTKYIGWQIDRDPSAILDDDREQEKILEFIQENPIPGLLKYYSTEYLEKMISGTAEKKDEADDDENSSEADNEDREARSSRKHRSDIDAADDDEAAERKSSRRGHDEDEEEVAERKPVKRGRSTDDEEEEPERKPVRRASSKRDEPEDEEEPSAKSGRRDDPPFDEDEEKPAHKARGRDPEEDDDEPAERKPVRRNLSSDDDENERPARKPGRR